MDFKALTGALRDCPCGAEHSCSFDAVEIGRGVRERAGGILKRCGFGPKLLVVADQNSLAAAGDLPAVLRDAGFDCAIECYRNLRTAELGEAQRIAALCEPFDGVLAVGTGSLDDICRYGAAQRNKRFAIFATAPSMDGFASSISPLTDRNFKQNYDARQPSVILADLAVLAAAPVELKAAGFGDILAKFVALTDWEISALVSGERYCKRIATMTRAVAERVASLAGGVRGEDEASAAAIMEALVLTGAAMTLAGSPRPASGAEHDLSHFWEIKTLERGAIPDYHGKTVAVATVLINRLYRRLSDVEAVAPAGETLDWTALSRVYGENFIGQVRTFQDPPVTREVSPERLRECWPQIRAILKRLPTDEQMTRWMQEAGAATTPEEISISREDCLDGLAYHPYMRRRVTLMRLLPMLNVPVDFSALTGAPAGRE